MSSLCYHTVAELLYVYYCCFCYLTRENHWWLKNSKLNTNCSAVHPILDGRRQQTIMQQNPIKSLHYYVLNKYLRYIV